MAQDEFSIIKRHFSDLGPVCPDTLLGVGDDAAVVKLADRHQLVVCLDTLIGGVHFPLDTDPADIAYKALAVNLSDLAAMAAQPAWFLLSLTLPESDSNWLARFALGLRQCANAYQLQLIGGDTCRGPLAVTIQAAGTVREGAYVERAGAEVGDLVLVSGELGNASLGLAELRGEIELPPALRDPCRQALNRPRARIELIPFLSEFAHAAIDVSDGLAADLGHIVEASHCGARVQRERLPVNDWIGGKQAFEYALGGGDDYEICCCVPSRYQAEIDGWNLAHPQCRLRVIGEITEIGYYLQTGESNIELSGRDGYRHFD